MGEKWNYGHLKTPETRAMTQEQRSSDLQLPGNLHMVVVDEDVGDEGLPRRREGRRSLRDVWLNDHLQQGVRTSGPVPDLKRQPDRDPVSHYSGHNFYTPHGFQISPLKRCWC